MLYAQYGLTIDPNVLKGQMGQLSLNPAPAAAATLNQAAYQNPNFYSTFPTDFAATANLLATPNPTTATTATTTGAAAAAGTAAAPATATTAVPAANPTAVAAAMPTPVPNMAQMSMPQAMLGQQAAYGYPQFSAYNPYNPYGQGGFNAYGAPGMSMPGLGMNPNSASFMMPDMSALYGGGGGYDAYGTTLNPTATGGVAAASTYSPMTANVPTAFGGGNHNNKAGGAVGGGQGSAKGNKADDYSQGYYGMNTGYGQQNSGYQYPAFGTASAQTAPVANAAPKAFGNNNSWGQQTAAPAAGGQTAGGFGGYQGWGGAQAQQSQQAQAWGGSNQDGAGDNKGSTQQQQQQQQQQQAAWQQYQYQGYQQ